MTWQLVEHTPPRVTCLTKIGSTIFAGTSSSGIFRSIDNMKTWIASKTDFIKSNISCLGRRGNELYASPINGGGIFRTTDDGNSWIQLDNGLQDNDTITCFKENGKSLFAGGSTGKIFKFSDTNNTWYSKFDAPGKITSFAVQNNQVIAGVAHCQQCLYSSTNDGELFTHVSGAPKTVLLDNDNFVYSMAFFHNTLFIYSSWDYDYSGIYYSKDLNSFRPIRRGLYNGATDVPYFTFLEQPTRLLMVSKTGNISSVDEDSIRGLVNTRIPSFGANCLSYDEKYLFAGTRQGIYFSVIGDTNWFPFSHGLPDSMFVNSLLTKGNYLFAATLRNGVWRRPISGITEISNPSLYTTKRISLSDFLNTSSTTNHIHKILISHGTTGFVKISICNISGKTVKILANNVMPPGQFEINWDSQQYASGIYLITYKTEKNIFTRCISTIGK
jgi:hypothetical protein